MPRRRERWSDFERIADNLRKTSRHRRLVTGSHRGVTFEQNGQTMVNFGSNDYLGFGQNGAYTNHRTDSGASDCFRATGSGATGSGASALVTGWSDAHQRLADRIASLKQSESALIFGTGYAACSGVMATLPGPKDLILSDRLNHASLIDGCRLSPAEIRIYPHRDVQWIADALRTDRHRYTRVWIATDAVFSMDGTTAPLASLCDVARQYNAELIVDEAHATGVLAGGAGGLCEATKLTNRVAVRIGTFSKAIGVQGGFVVADQPVIDHLINHCRSFIYSTAMSPLLVDAIESNLDRMGADDGPRTRVRDLARHVRGELGLIDGNHQNDPLQTSMPIIPVVLGDDQTAMDAAKDLARQGLHVPAIRPPTVPEDTARLRISLSASHTDSQVERLCRAVRSCMLERE